MRRKLIGKVSKSETTEIRNIFLRKKSLNSMLNIINRSDKELYDKLKEDIVSVDIQFQEWWDSKSKKYSWESVSGGRWQIDFDTCEIFLITND